MEMSIVKNYMLQLLSVQKSSYMTKHKYYNITTISRELMSVTSIHVNRSDLTDIIALEKVQYQ